MASHSGESVTSRENFAMTKDIPKLITSFGPAGSKLSIREAGENILKNFCHGYPNTDVHSIIPNFFSGNITELMTPRPNITRKEEEKRRGREINQEGEKHEYAVFNLFARLIRQTYISPSLLIMRTFEMDTKNPVALKRKALMSELPGLNLKSAITTAENDFVVLVKDYGVVFIEAKGSTKDSNVKSAEKQLTNVNSIVQSVMKAMSNDKQRTIPTVKLIVIPDCVDPSPTNKTSQGSYFLFKDNCDNFETKWMEVVNELLEQKSSNAFSSDEFRELSQILVGIWSANAVSAINEGVRSYHLEQNETQFSDVKQLEEIDAVIDTSNVRNESHFKLQEDKRNPFTDMVRTSEQDIFQSSNDIKLCYLTPTQKEVFDHHKHALIHGVGGCGKSLLLIFKVLELVNTSNSRILILAPAPHNLRIYTFLRSNNVSVDIIEEFPPSFSESNVFVMDIKRFYNVRRSILMNHDLSKFHLFADDAQHMILNGICNEGDSVSFFDVGDFLEQTYETCLENDTHCWFMLDVMQGHRSMGGTGEYSVHFFKTRDNQPREYNIPLIQLQHVMRNTSEVVQLTNEIRSSYVSFYRTTSAPTPKVGHKITSRRPLQHLLQLGTDDKYKLPFIIEQLREELKSVTNPPYLLPLSSVAIIWDNEQYFNKLRWAITSFLSVEFSTTAQTVRKQLVLKDRKDVIMDVVDNVMSLESPVVVFIRSDGGGGRPSYNICTRARVSLIVINVSGISSLKDFNNIDTVKWEPDNNTEKTFIKNTREHNSDLVVSAIPSHSPDITANPPDLFSQDITTNPNPFSQDITTNPDLFSPDITTNPNPFSQDITTYPDPFSQDITTNPDLFSPDITTNPNLFSQDITIDPNPFSPDVPIYPGLFPRHPEIPKGN